MKKSLNVLFSVMVILGLCSSTVFAFNDVSDDLPFYSSINYLADEGILVGYEDGTFGYDKPISRAELLKVAYESSWLAGYVTTDEAFSGGCFDDVPEEEWYSHYVCKSKHDGVVVGYDDGTFRPHDDVTFVEALKIVLEIFGTDYEETDIWYRGPVDAGGGQNIIPLTIDEFNRPITRGEVADMVTRKVKYENGVLDDFLGEPLASEVADYDFIENQEPALSYIFSYESILNLCTYNGVSYDFGVDVHKDECITCECVNMDLRYCKNNCLEDKTQCEIDGVLYNSGDQVQMNECTTGTCVDGEVVDFVKSCELVEGQCEYEGFVYEDGEQVSPLRDYCYTRECVDGEVVEYDYCG